MSSDLHQRIQAAFAGEPRAIADIIPAGVLAALAADPKVAACVSVAQLRAFYHPSPEGTFPRLVVALEAMEDGGVFSKIRDGEITVLAVLEWREMAGAYRLDPTKHTVTSLLAHMQDILDSLEITSEGIIITTSGVTWRTVAGPPLEVEGGVVVYLGISGTWRIRTVQGDRTETA